MTSASRRRVLWLSLGVSLGLAGLAAIAALAAGGGTETLWRAIGTLVILCLCGGAVLAGLELLNRRMFGPLGFAVIATAPAEGATLVVAEWKEHISASFANGVVTAVLFLLSGLVVSTLRLIVSLDRPAVLVVFVGVVACTIALDALATPLIWVSNAPDSGLRVVLGLIVLTVVGYAVAPIVQRFSRSNLSRRGRLA